ncbi:hypothetical protein M378DRAFT_369867 [Amanita muscaria Koide BX008]|uniref:Uncharacterized protein n=1 Tax=Amanita muscaria (strain Koide BX008) TaxID=946122 RepID=A0A0C2WXR3_AMAMK|nr:hypothetical protein M378DRAFT_369867 [Amanita muscaria Koide BX008]
MVPATRPGGEQTKVESSTSEVVNVRLVKRARSNAVASSPRVKLEDMPRQPSIVDSAEDIVNLVGNADSARAYESARFHHRCIGLYST